MVLKRLKLLETVLDQSPAVVFVWRVEEGWPVEYVTGNVSQFGYSAEDFLTGRVSWPGITYEEDIPRLEAEIQAFLSTGEDTFSQEYRLYTKAGEVRWIEDRNRFLRDQAGAISHIQGTIVDVTQRRQALLALQESEERARVLLDACTEAVVLLDPAGVILDVNDAFTSHFGKGKAEFAGLSLGQLLPSGLATQNRRLFGRVLKRAEPARTECRYKDRWYEVKMYPLHGFRGEVSRVAVFAQDVTEQKLHDQQNQWYQDQLQSLALELTFAEERERRRLATTLHDDVGQLLILAKIKLGLLRQTADADAFREPLGELDQLLSRAVSSTRSLTNQLSHTALYELGFEAAAQWLAEDIESLYGLKVRLNTQRMDLNLGERWRVLLFQCLRELLVNAAKHASASEARVHLEQHGQSVRVVVEDDGCGFDPHNIRTASGDGGFGLFSIRERIQQLGGAIHIHTGQDQGTRVVLEVPSGCATVDHAPCAGQEATSR